MISGPWNSSFMDSPGCFFFDWPHRLQRFLAHSGWPWRSWAFMEWFHIPLANVRVRLAFAWQLELETANPEVGFGSRVGFGWGGSGHGPIPCMGSHPSNDEPPRGYQRQRSIHLSDRRILPNGGCSGGVLDSGPPRHTCRPDDSPTLSIASGPRLDDH
jgi:hypothetical protein